MGTQPLCLRTTNLTGQKANVKMIILAFHEHNLWGALNKPTNSKTFSPEIEEQVWPDSPESVAYWPFLTRPGISCHSYTSAGEPVGQATSQPSKPTLSRCLLIRSSGWFFKVKTLISAGCIFENATKLPNRHMNYPEEENPWEIDQLMHGIAIKQMEELLAVESSEERVD